MCIDYPKLNKATKKDRFPLPFTDEMLERLAKHSFFCFLDGIQVITRYRSIQMTKAKPPLHVHMKLMCTVGCFLGYVMLQLLFQRCMMSIFSDMIKEIMEVFMDDFSVYGKTFDDYLENLDKVLQRCEEKHLVHN